MLVQQMGLVSETRSVSASDLTQASAALQKQLTRDFGSIWGIDATIDAFDRLEDVPLGYWPVIVMDDIQVPGAAGIHLDKDGQPFALVQAGNRWTLTASHEVLEMAADPFGNRIVSSRSKQEDQGRVEYLVEVCDPSEAPDFAYHVNGVAVSDFYTQHFFDPVTDPCVRYSFTGAIKEPRQVLKGGYLSWHDPVSDHWWQERFFGAEPQFVDLGVFDTNSARNLRAWIDSITEVPGLLEDVPEESDFRKGLLASSTAVQNASEAKAASLRTQIGAIKRLR